MAWDWKVSRRVVRKRAGHLRFIVREAWSLYGITMRTYEVARFADLHEALCHLGLWMKRRNEVFYCRFGDDSNVYLHEVHGEIVCAFCTLDPDYADVHLADPDDAGDHLLEHRRAGHRVPQEAMSKLQLEAEETSQPSSPNKR
jgi:hypothetical protein